VTAGSRGRFWCWLIERLVSTPDRDAMLGDLIEQAGRGRSAGWWALQASAIILGSLAREIAGHRGLVAAVPVVACATAALAGSVVRFSPDAVTIVAVGVVFRVFRPIRVSALFVLVAFVSATRFGAVSVVVMSILGHAGGLEFLVRQGLSHVSMPVLVGAVLVALAARQRPLDPRASHVAA
jgi:hypothetical protein